jgi:hypothetical protein
VKNASQFELFDRSQPAAVECSGPELGALLASLRERGAVVLGMASVCVSRWRLSLGWTTQKARRQTDRRAGAGIGKVNSLRPPLPATAGR